MLIITKQGVKGLSQRLNNGVELGACRDEVKKMLEIKSALLWRAEFGRGCCSWQLVDYLDSEVQTLEDVLDALEKGSISQASSLLRDYVNQLED